MLRYLRLPFAAFRKKGLLFFVVAILFIAILSLVAMFMQTERIPTAIQMELGVRDMRERSRQASRVKNERNLMQRIWYLEEEIAKNRESQAMLKEHVERLRANQSDPALYMQLLESLSERDRRSEAVGKSVAEPYSAEEIAVLSKCASSYATNAEADVNIAKLYDELEFDNADGGAWKQGWPVEEPTNTWNQSYKLYVHVVPHSHQDPGWVKTIDEYFGGQVHQILDATMSALAKDDKYRFIYAEMCFLDMYYAQANEDKRAELLHALEKKQLELVTGGWVMTDEASVHVYAMLDLLVEGHAFINKTLKTASRTRATSSWSIDPFGYSTTVHYVLKKQLARGRQLEFRWRQPFDTTGRHEVFTHVMPFYSYDIPHTCGPEPAVCCQFDFMRMPGDRHSCPWHTPAQAINQNNVAERARTLLTQYRKHASLYRTNQLLVILGDDFRYESMAEFSKQFDNYGKLFDHLNADKSYHVELKWSTLAEYFSAVRYATPPLRENLMPASLPTLVGDFHTYADRDDHYWSGYFTSRPFQKWMSRQLEFHLRTAEQLVMFASASSLTSQKDSHYKFNVPGSLTKLRRVRRALGIFQHHDSITGTSKDHVVRDNANRLFDAMNAAKQLLNTAAAFLLLNTDPKIPDAKEKSSETVDGDTVFKLDELYTDANSPPTRLIVNVDKVAHLMLYNSLTIQRATLYRVQVNTPFVGVLNVNDGRFVEAQVDPVWNHEFDILNNAYQLTFRISIPPLSFLKYRLVRFDDEATMRKSSRTQLAVLTLHNMRARYSDLVADPKAFLSKRMAPFTADLADSLEFIDLQSDQVSLRVSSHSGMLSSATVHGNAVRSEFSYLSYGTRSGRERSGAYLFLPDGPAKLLKAEQPLIRLHRGPLSDELHVALQYVNHTLRFVKAPGLLTSNTVELQNLVDIRTAFNLEFGFRVQTDLNTGEDDEHSVFHADQNCFQMARRKTQLPKVPLQGNLYPFTCAAFIEDSASRVRFNLLSQQSLSVASLKRGALEVILDRRLNQDDGRGLEQGVMDNRLTLSSFRFLFSVPNDKQSIDRSQSNGQLDLFAHWNMLELNNPVFMFSPKQESDDDSKLSDPRSDYSQFDKKLSLSQSDSFPCDTHLVNLRSMGNSEALSAGVFLHRFGTDCNWLPDTLSSMRPFCSAASNGVFNLQSLLDSHSAKLLKRLSHSSLDLLDDLQELTPSKFNITIDAFEIEAFKIDF